MSTQKIGELEFGFTGMLPYITYHLLSKRKQELSQGAMGTDQAEATNWCSSKIQVSKL